MKTDFPFDDPNLEPMSLQDLAQAAGVSMRTLWRRVQEGELPEPRIIGKRACVPKPAAEAFMRKLIQGNGR